MQPMPGLQSSVEQKAAVAAFVPAGPHHWPLGLPILIIVTIEHLSVFPGQTCKPFGRGSFPRSTIASPRERMTVHMRGPEGVMGSEVPMTRRKAMKVNRLWDLRQKEAR